MSTTIIQTLTPSQNTVIQTVFSVCNMALVALSFVPGIPAAAIAVARTALTDAEAAYKAYTANPTAALFDDIATVISTAIADLKSILHP